MAASRVQILSVRKVYKKRALQTQNILTDKKKTELTDNVFYLATVGLFKLFCFFLGSLSFSSRYNNIRIVCVVHLSNDL